MPGVGMMGQGEENAVGSHTCLFSTCGSKDYSFSKASCFKSSEVQLTRSVNVLGENNKVPSIFCQKFGGERCYSKERKGTVEERKKSSRNAKPRLPFLAAASFLSFLNFSKARRMSTILLVSACFFLTSDRTPSAAALSSCSWGRKSP